MLKDFMDMLLHWLPTTTVASYMRGNWEWPAAESLHFIGLSMLLGTVGLFDLRLLGLGRSISISALHRLIPWGVLGFVINMLTGICFFTAQPDLFMFNPALQLKVLFILIAGLNILVFYTTMFRKVKVLGPGENAPAAARVIGGISLFLWLGVIVFGRLLTFYKPPEHWCPWC
jgi:hypothetical protein